MKRGRRRRWEESFWRIHNKTEREGEKGDIFITLYPNILMPDPGPSRLLGIEGALLEALRGDVAHLALKLGGLITDLGDR